MAADSMRLDSPAAQEELKYLKTVEVGTVRQTPLIPALDVPMEWVCTKIEGEKWWFEGRFCKFPFMAVIVEVTKKDLIMTGVPL